MKYDIESINKRKENVKIAKKVIEIIAIILIYNIILIALSSANKISVVNILGYKSYIIKTNSMEPTISINDVVITKKVKKEKIKKGDVITFLQDGEVITHRITQIDDNGNYTTKGDNNNIEDTFKTALIFSTSPWANIVPFVFNIYRPIPSSSNTFNIPIVLSIFILPSNSSPKLLKILSTISLSNIFSKSSFNPIFFYAVYYTTFLLSQSFTNLCYINSSIFCDNSI